MSSATHRRRQQILGLLGREERLTVEGLVAHLRVSPATIRRDLRYLEEEGALRRDHGGAISRDPLLFEPFLHDSTFREQVRHLALEKQRIGAAAANLIHDGETIGLGGGTTVSKVLRGLRARKDLTVVTYAVNVALELSRQKNLHVHVTGGYLSGDWFALVGPRAMESVSHFFLDKYILGAGGVHAERGITDRHTEEAAMNRAMLQQSKTGILLADHTKLGVVARCLVCQLTDIKVLVTDIGASDAMIHPFLARGIEVKRV